ncbi:dna photolyase cryptochrome [Plasmopara halstedii]|uniref:Dna photolyase cryptochrome n=1 Tax=Plasmopara halstedii TaxID=4781 RepID=A0A0P1AZJ8_PLAHL|nr:dna photolyase cryptochrome [Plasmopara halstedii]CEG47887.1 dna photolyase cryptochrome [Plasmopara halstedii]|eukprot:XP_024584256.1 dna photolyase cryptochrome [Plasmopara halstedii]
MTRKRLRHASVHNVDDPMVLQHCQIDVNVADEENTSISKSHSNLIDNFGPAPEHPKRRALVWFRRDLRLHDNLALDAAMRAQEQFWRATNEDMALLPIYILHKPKRQRCGAVRFQFLLEAIMDVAISIEKMHGRLLVLRGDAEHVLHTVMAAWHITDLFFEAGVMPYAVERDSRVRAIAKSLNVNVTMIRGGTLYDPHEIIRLNGGVPPDEYERLLEITEKMPQPTQPIPAPFKLPHAASFNTKELYFLLKSYCHDHNSEVADAIAGINVNTEKNDTTLFVVPPLTVFGLTPPDPHTTLIGGETEALKRLDEFCEDERRVGMFEKPKTSPVSVDVPSTTSLSAHLTFGCLSAREFFYRIMFIQLQFSQRPGFPVQVTLEGQLMWREFFYCYACGTPNFDSFYSNPGCKQIDWRLLAMKDDIVNDHNMLEADEKLAVRQLECWKEGRTGFPWIDAVMRQINQEGWTHHAGRHAVASFLTRGVLYISWLQGALYFQEKLIDMDWALNIGNWLWVSASCFFTDYRQVASPSTFPQHWDPHGHFIRKYIPALRNMPDKFVYEPWKAPLKVQRDADCLVGKDYPFPIVDSKLAMSRCAAGMSHAFSDTETAAVISDRKLTEESETLSWSADDMCYGYRSIASSSQL